MDLVEENVSGEQVRHLLISSSATPRPNSACHLTAGTYDALSLRSLTEQGSQTLVSVCRSMVQDLFRMRSTLFRAVSLRPITT